MFPAQPFTVCVPCAGPERCVLDTVFPGVPGSAWS